MSNVVAMNRLKCLLQHIAPNTATNHDYDVSVTQRKSLAIMEQVLHRDTALTDEDLLALNKIGFFPGIQQHAKCKFSNNDRRTRS